MVTSVSCSLTVVADLPSSECCPQLDIVILLAIVTPFGSTIASCHSLFFIIRSGAKSVATHIKTFVKCAVHALQKAIG